MEIKLSLPVVYGGMPPGASADGDTRSPGSVGKTPGQQEPLIPVSSRPTGDIVDITGWSFDQVEGKRSFTRGGISSTGDAAPSPSLDAVVLKSDARMDTIPSRAASQDHQQTYDRLGRSSVALDAGTTEKGFIIDTWV